MECVTLLLRDITNGQLFGVAVICPCARYATMLTARGISHCDAPPAVWRRVERQIVLGLPSGPLEWTSGLVELLVPRDLRSSIVVQYLSKRPMADNSYPMASHHLDALLAAW